MIREIGIRLNRFIRRQFRSLVRSIFGDKKRRRFQYEMKVKTKVIMAFVFAGFGIVVGHLIYIVAKEGMEYEKLVLEQQNYTSTTIPYKRGDIVDANGTVLATSRKIYSLVLEPKNILLYEDNRDVTIAALKKYFSISDSEMDELLSNTESYREVALKNLEYDDIKPFLDYQETDEGSAVMGVLFEEEYERIYPNDSLACHVVGFTSSDGSGINGIESSYNEYLSGTNGRKYTYINENYNLTDSVEDAVNGYNIITSIDANIQTIIEKKVTKYMEEEGAENVSVLVMDPSDSSVLALYNSHSYDLNNPRDLSAVRYQYADMTDSEFEAYEESMSDDEISTALNKLWRNFVISDVFEPGSTYKTFTISGALEEGAISEDESFYCDGGEQKDIYYIKCHYAQYGGHGMLDVSGALANSCNDALMQIAVKEGADDFDKYQQLFGFGQKTNIDIPGEPTNAAMSTAIYHADTLHVTELATSSFGQGVNVSMMELGTAFCSVINGGYYYEPSVVQRIEDENGNVIEDRSSVLVRRTISEDVSEFMKQALFEVVDSGTGKKASVEGYSIGGKTGTAEKLPRGNGKYIISFIGFAPVDDPQVVVYVLVDEPNVEDQSSSAASSLLFADIAEELFPYLNIYKDNDNYDLDLSDAEDELTDSIYEGEIPENDVAGGGVLNEIDETTGEEGTEETTEETTEAASEESTEENSDETYTPAEDDGAAYNE
jgi:stage V sporulation protein D (sporulation-specific penicillin-binding protein)